MALDHPIQRHLLAKNSELLIDLQIDKKLVLVVERADRLHRALLAIVLGPNLIVRILRQLAEPVGALSIGEVALHSQAPAVLQVNHGSFNRSIRTIDNLTLDNALRRPAILPEHSYAPHSNRKDCHATHGK